MREASSVAELWVARSLPKRSTSSMFVRKGIFVFLREHLENRQEQQQRKCMSDTRNQITAHHRKISTRSIKVVRLANFLFGWKRNEETLPNSEICLVTENMIFSFPGFCSTNRYRWWRLFPQIVEIGFVVFAIVLRKGCFQFYHKVAILFLSAGLICRRAPVAERPSRSATKVNLPQLRR